MLTQLTIKLAVGFIALFLVTKFIGGRELKHLTIFDFISAIVLSELVGSMLYDEEINVLYMIYSLTFWTLLNYAIDKLTLKARKARKFFDGDIELVVKNNVIDKAILRKHRIDLHEFLSLLREKDVYSIREVGYAFLEPNGGLNVIKGDSVNKGRIAKDLLLPLPVIMDGQIIENALGLLGKDRTWLREEIGKFGFSQASELFYAEYIEGQGLFVQAQP
ncbi:DUF421 domain-containing protein [Paenibacillus antri]|uniref:DUF421 domain-containing protein n=1 Tax=Paenibacillus antri TaxID=2582848 RepID=A0A5R9GBA1_9BACL|nr:DUF421 domain-containing protein [Paenibacillus antri]TLS52369.1 DUF421 domain-containing protein [Paenibacillus antri]